MEKTTDNISGEHRPDIIQTQIGQTYNINMQNPIETTNDTMISSKFSYDRTPPISDHPYLTTVIPDVAESCNPFEYTICGAVSKYVINFVLSVTDITVDDIYYFICPPEEFKNPYHPEHEYSRLVERATDIFENRTVDSNLIDFLYIYKHFRPGTNTFSENVLTYLTHLQKELPGSSKRLLVCIAIAICYSGNLVYADKAWWEYSITTCTWTERKPEAFSGKLMEYIEELSSVLYFKIPFNNIKTLASEIAPYLSSDVLAKELNKCTVFVMGRHMTVNNYRIMKACTFDTTKLFLHRPLPSDGNTKMAVGCPYFAKYAEKYKEMIDAMCSWWSERGIAETLLDLLGVSLERYEPRQCVIHYSSGSSGKSSFLNFIGPGVFGTYYAPLNAGALAGDPRDPNAPTPALNVLMGAKLAGIADSRMKGNMVDGPVFKGLMGDDVPTFRKMYKEQQPVTHRSKALVMVCTNKEGITVRNVADLSRLLFVPWAKMILTSESKAILPAHLVNTSSDAEHDFGAKLAREYKDVMVCELIMRHCRYKYAGKIYIDPIIEAYTKKLLLDNNPINIFLRQTTVVEPSIRGTGYNGEFPEYNPLVHTLLKDYYGWARAMGKSYLASSFTDEDFANSLKLFVNVVTAETHIGFVQYCDGIRYLTPEERYYQSNGSGERTAIMSGNSSSIGSRLIGWNNDK